MKNNSNPQRGSNFLADLTPLSEDDEISPKLFPQSGSNFVADLAPLSEDDEISPKLFPQSGSNFVVVIVNNLHDTIPLTVIYMINFIFCINM